MALIDSIEFYGGAVEAGAMDLDTAVRHLTEASNGGLTKTDARDSIINRKTRRSDYERIFALANQVGKSTAASMLLAHKVCSSGACVLGCPACVAERVPRMFLPLGGSVRVTKLTEGKIILTEGDPVAPNHALTLDHEQQTRLREHLPAPQPTREPPLPEVRISRNGQQAAVRNARNPERPDLTWRATNGAHLSDEQVEHWITLRPDDEQ